jgi:hypothetical protein
MVLNKWQPRRTTSINENRNRQQQDPMKRKIRNCHPKTGPTTSTGVAVKWAT